MRGLSQRAAQPAFGLHTGVSLDASEHCIQRLVCLLVPNQGTARAIGLSVPRLLVLPAGEVVD